MSDTTVPADTSDKAFQSMKLEDLHISPRRSGGQIPRLVAAALDVIAKEGSGVSTGTCQPVWGQHRKVSLCICIEGRREPTVQSLQSACRSSGTACGINSTSSDIYSGE